MQNKRQAERAGEATHPLIETADAEVFDVETGETIYLDEPGYGTDGIAEVG